MSKDTRLIGKVYETTNYDKFKLIISNRPLMTKGVHYKRLKNSIIEKGQLEPAIVNENYEIINGQHRWSICKELGIPFVFEVWEGLKVTDVPDANISSEWKMKHFINLYASNGCENTTSYQYLQALIKEFCPPMVLSNITTIMGMRGGNSQTILKEGRFVMTTAEYEAVRRCIADLIKLGYLKWIKENRRSSNAYWLAVAYAWRHPKVDSERLIKLMWQNAIKIPSSTKTKEYLRCFSDIYNKNLVIKKKVYLDQDYEQKLYREW